MKINVLFILLSIGLLACKNDKSGSDSNSQSYDLAEYESNTPIHPDKLPLPPSCDLLSEVWIKETLGLTLSDVSRKESEDPGNPNARSCFFRWEDPATPNAGIFIQLMTNPVFNEYDAWISTFVNAKLSEGETPLGSEEAYKYKRFDAGKYKGAYSYDLKRFYWNIGNNYLFMLAFNLDIPESKMLGYAEKISAKVNENFAEKVKSMQ